MTTHSHYSARYLLVGVAPHDAAAVLIVWGYLRILAVQITAPPGITPIIIDCRCASIEPPTSLQLIGAVQIGFGIVVLIVRREGLSVGWWFTVGRG